MKIHQSSKVVRWIARIYGSIILAIPLVAIFQRITSEHSLTSDWKTTVLYMGLISGLSLALKWELPGGFIVLLTVIITGFVHPILILAGLLYIISWILRRRSGSLISKAES